MQVFNFAESNSVLNQYVSEIRDVAVQTDRLRFRRNIERIGELMAYEMSKHLSYSVKQVQTPLGIAESSTPDDQLVVGTVFRAGLPLHTGFLNVFDQADNAFVSAYRYYKDKECRELDVHIEYIATYLILRVFGFRISHSLQVLWDPNLKQNIPIIHKSGKLCLQ